MQGFSPEVIVDKSLAKFFSGSGFSNYFPTPLYHIRVVATYETKLGVTDRGYYNKIGRAYPDVFAQGSLQEVIVNQKNKLGTPLVLRYSFSFTHALSHHTVFTIHEFASFSFSFRDAALSWRNLRLCTDNCLRSDAPE